MLYQNREHKEARAWKQQQQQQNSHSNDKKTAKARTHRAPWRVKEILKSLPQSLITASKVTASEGVESGFSALRLLDVGCSEGSVTASLGEALNISIENRLGVDVRDLPKTDGFTFILTAENSFLPVANNSCDIVVILMVLHHLSDPKRMISDIFRVLKPGGVCVLREHDCTRRELAPVLDILHGLYVNVFPVQPEFGSFASKCIQFFFEPNLIPLNSVEPVCIP